jgi:hypothetical protein
MALITSSRYSAVASTLALALAAAGTGYAATSLPRHPAAHHKKPTNTSPTLVVDVAPNGKVIANLHRAPITGKPKIKHPSDGFYVFTLPGMKLNTSGDSATCSVANYLTATATVDGVGHSFAVHVFDAAGNPADIGFQCAFWHIPRKK